MYGPIVTNKSNVYSMTLAFKGSGQGYGGYGNFGFRSLLGLLALNSGDLSALCPQIGM